MEVSRLTAELPGKEMSFYYVPFIQRAYAGHPRPKALAMIIGVGANGQAQTKGSPPVITFSYAQEKIRQGEEWRIYISASDPDGDMSKIYCAIHQPGGQPYRPDVTRLKKGMEEKFSGYLFLRTNSQFSLRGSALPLRLLSSTVQETRVNLLSFH